MKTIGAWVLTTLGLLATAGNRSSAASDVDPFFVPRQESYGSHGIVAPQPRPPNLARQIGTDFKNVFSRESLIVVRAGLIAAWGASHFDDRIASSRLNSELRSEPGLDHFFEGGEIIGGGLVQVGGALATYGLGKIASKPLLEDVGRDLLRAQVLTQTLTLGAKFASGRRRPDGENRRSFPSGHASGTFATATVLQQRFGWKVGAAAYAVAGYVAVSRLNEARHYLSDVVFGAAVGILVGRTVSAHLRKGRFAMHPMASAGGVGVQLTWLGSEK